MPKVTIKGLDELAEKLKNIGEELSDEAMREILLTAGFEIQIAVKKSMNEPKTGIIYGVTRMVERSVFTTVKDFDGSKFRIKTGTKKVKARKKHQASAPGDAPAVDTGALVNSIKTEADGSNRVLVGTNSEYAEPLEFGTARMAARPFLRPAIENSKERIETVVIKKAKDILERLTK